MIVSPSLLAADKTRLPLEAMKMKNAGASYIHIDIMDGRFVPASTWDHKVVEELRKNTHGLILDTHLMIENPESHIDDYINAGADIITVHYEAFPDEESLIRTLIRIRKAGVIPGLAIKPATVPDRVKRVLPYCGHIIVMTVEPGMGGQPFMMGQLHSIARVRELLALTNTDAKISVDGGVNEKTARFCKDFGADVLVAGSYLYGREDYEERLRGLLAL